MSEFLLHPQLASDTFEVGDWNLSRLLLMDDSRFPWLILVPRRPGLVELFDIAPSDRLELIDEIARAATALKALAGADKINVGSLGNLVPQFHIHIVARRRDDAAWPGPVWGFAKREPYSGTSRDEWIDRLTAALKIRGPSR